MPILTRISVPDPMWFVSGPNYRGSASVIELAHDAAKIAIAGIMTAVLPGKIYCLVLVLVGWRPPNSHAPRPPNDGLGAAINPDV